MSIFAALAGLSGTYGNQARDRIDQRAEEVKERRRQAMAKELLDYKSGIDREDSTVAFDREMQRLDATTAKEKGLIGARTGAALQADAVKRQRDLEDSTNERARRAGILTGATDPETLSVDYRKGADLFTASGDLEGAADVRAAEKGADYASKWENDRNRTTLTALANMLENEYDPQKKAEYQQQIDYLLKSMYPAMGAPKRGAYTAEQIMTRVKALRERGEDASADELEALAKQEGLL